MCKHVCAETTHGMKNSLLPFLPVSRDDVVVIKRFENLAEQGDDMLVRVHTNALKLGAFILSKYDSTCVGERVRG